MHVIAAYSIYVGIWGAASSKQVISSMHGWREEGLITRRNALNRIQKKKEGSRRDLCFNRLAKDQRLGRLDLLCRSTCLGGALYLEITFDFSSFGA